MTIKDALIDEVSEIVFHHGREPTKSSVSPDYNALDGEAGGQPASHLTVQEASLTAASLVLSWGSGRTPVAGIPSPHMAGETWGSEVRCPGTPRGPYQWRLGPAT